MRNYQRQYSLICAITFALFVGVLFGRAHAPGRTSHYPGLLDFNYCTFADHKGSDFSCLSFGDTEDRTQKE